MKRSRFTEEQILFALKQIAARVAAGFHAYWIPRRELWGGLPRI